MGVVLSMVDGRRGGFDIMADGTMQLRPLPADLSPRGSLRLVDAAGNPVQVSETKAGAEGPVVFSAPLLAGGVLDIHSSGVVRVREAMT